MAFLVWVANARLQTESTLVEVIGTLGAINMEVVVARCNDARNKEFI